MEQKSLIKHLWPVLSDDDDDIVSLAGGVTRLVVPNMTDETVQTDA